MADIKAIQRKMSNTKLKLSDLNPHLMCVLCGGYYIDATTIVECLHSFCRSCIVKHLESSKYCPICEVQVHKTKPLINIRPDKTLQNIVYKLVPGLFTSEMRNRRRFYRERPHYVKPNDSESSGEVAGERKIYVNDENITFSLVYHEGPGPGGGPRSGEDWCRELPPPAQNERRYFKCPTGVTVHHLKKLIRAKNELSDSNYRVEIYFRDQELHQDFTLLDISYVYLWKTKKGSLDLTYKIMENVVKRQKMEEAPERGVTDTCEQVKSSGEGEEEKDKEEKEKEKGEEERRKDETELKEERKEAEQRRSEDSGAAGAAGAAGEPPVKTLAEPAKENGLTGTEAKEVQLQISESGVMSVSQVEDSEIVRTVEEAATKVTNNETTSTGVPVARKEVKESTGNGTVKRPEKKPAGKASKPYKTIRCSPKTWHPVIPKEKLRPTLMNNSDEPRKPMKFFKMRNMPRFLGNPSGGVKPMFAEAPRKHQEEKKPEPGKAVNKILKIDPKTLRPIEKEELKMASAPSAPNLLTNPFIPNNNHFLFSDLHLLPPNTGSYKEKPPPPGQTGFKGPAAPNGSYPPICFPPPDHSPPGFYPFPVGGGLTKTPQSFPFPDKMDPLLRASRLSPFGNLAGFNIAGFHASLPPSISRLLNPHHHFRKINQTLEKKNKDESTKETTKRCDDSFNVSKGEEEEEEEEKEEEEVVEEREEEKVVKEEKKKGGTVTKREKEKEKGKGREKEKEKENEKEKGKEGEAVGEGKGEGEKEGKKEKKKEMNGETSDESASQLQSDSSASTREKDKEKDKDR